MSAFGNAVNDVIVLEINHECAVFPAGNRRIANRIVLADGLPPAVLDGVLGHAAGRAVTRLCADPVDNERVS